MVEKSTHFPETAETQERPAHSPEQEVLKFISGFATLSDAEVRAVIDALDIRTFEKGALLLREGQIANLCYFVLKGCIRQYYLVDGEEKTTHFYTEGQPITPYEGTFKRMPSPYYLSCVENSILTVGGPEKEAELFQAFPRLQVVCRLATEEELAKSQENLASYILKSPEERYLHLLRTRPELLDRVPQYHLASYLGIKPESLSRIRKRIMCKHIGT